MNELDVVEWLRSFATMNARGEWIAQRDPNEGRRAKHIKPGSLIGYCQTRNKRSPRWRIYCGGRAWFRSRVNYAATTGKAPGDLTVDHVNEDTLDDRPSNLRLMTRAENSRIWHTAERRVWFPKLGHEATRRRGLENAMRYQWIVEPLYRDGMSLRAIARLLDERRIRTPEDGQRWSHSMVRRIVRRLNLDRSSQKVAA